MINQVFNENCLDTMSRMPAEYIDLTVTSPPYDNLRTYSGYSFEFEPIARELFRVTKPGGVVVWVVADATINGCETGTSFKQALHFKEIGFNLHDTMIWSKDSFVFPEHNTNRYPQTFDYMFIFSKGKPKTFHPLKDRINKSYTGNIKKQAYKTSNGKRELRKEKYVITPRRSKRFNVWEISIGNNKSSKNSNDFKQTAIFPDKLARDHILTWSNEGDTVLDPMAGSGTTPAMCIDTGRNYIACEISAEYVNDIIIPRIDEATRQGRLF